MKEKENSACGCGCCCHESTHEHTSPVGWRAYIAPLVSFLLLIVGLVGQHWVEHPQIRLAWYILAYLPVGLPVLKESWESIREGEYFSEFILMSIATIGAFIIGEYPEGVAVMLFYTIGELLQDKAVDRATRHIRELLDVRPEQATVIRGEQRIVLHPSEVQKDEIIEVKPGERIALDGILASPHVSLDTAALTGESLPKELTEGAEVLAGMIVLDNVIRVRVSRPYADSALSRILSMVQEATERKAPAELFIRHFARVYTPIVTLLATLIIALPFLYSWFVPSFTYIWQDWLYRGLVFLVISCPCALVISIPLGYFGGIGAASRQGILCKGGNYLDLLSKIDTIVFDKTGTLTKGQFSVRHICPAAGITSDQLLHTIASVERFSVHPIAKAIVNTTDVDQLSPVDNITEKGGFGLIATIAGKQVMVGKAQLLEMEGIAVDHEDTATTHVHCAMDGRYMGYIALEDTLKEDASDALQRLRQWGLSLHLLSGDRTSTVAQLASRLGIRHFLGDLLPADKVNHLTQLQQSSSRCVAFVGDGMNDAPVLALSHVGIAMGGLGTDVAIEAADVVIQTDQLAKIPAAIAIGRKTRQIIWQNIILAFGIKIVILLLSTAGYASLWAAVFADVGVALLAILNAVSIQYRIKI